MVPTSVDRVARILMVSGAILAVLGVTAWALDVIPPMPEWMLRLAIYKLTLAGAVGLIAVGAFLRRASRASALRRGGTDERALPDAGLDFPDARDVAKPKAEVRR